MKGLDVTMLMQVPPRVPSAAAAEAAAGGVPEAAASSKAHATWVLEDRYVEDYTTPALRASLPLGHLLERAQQQPQPPLGKMLLSVQTRPVDEIVAFTFSMPLSACVIPRAGPTSQFQKSAALSVPAPASSFTVALPLMDVPSVETRYMCMYVAPPRNEKYHIYRVLRKGKDEVSRSFVHHMFVFNAGDDEPETPVNVPFDCTSEVGGHGLPFYTENAGRPSTPPDALYEEVDAALPFGKGYDKYWLLQVHYNNPKGVTGVQDTTGVEILYSPTLRTHDMGILVLGAPPPSIALRLNSSLIIPPSLPTYDYLNYCPASCTTKHIAITETEEVEGGKEGRKEGGVMTPHILYAYVHMHLMATQGEIQLLRNTSSVTVVTAAAAVAAGGVGADAATAKEGGGKGGRLERFEMLYRRRWDARNQEGMTFPAPGFALQSDDAFLTRCRYDSSEKRTETFYGPGITDEMCLGIMLYYPAQKLRSTSLACMDLDDASSPDINFFGVNDKSKPMNLAICQPAHITANMSAHPKTAGLLAVTEGMTPFSRKEMLDAKEGFEKRQAGEEECA
ncbi:dopamine beta-hydroxylase [Nannochloropsis oceanica]